MKYEAREYKYLDGSSIQLEGKEVVERDEIKGHLFNNNINVGKKAVKFEGRIYEREEKLSLFNNDKDIEIVVPKFRRDYRLVGNYVGICHQNLMAMAKAGILPVMAGARREIWEVNNNKYINVENVESIQVDECISNGKWNGKLVSQKRYDEIMNEEGIVELMQRMFIRKIELMDNEGKKYEKNVRRVFENYDAGALAKLLSKEYKGIYPNWGIKVKEVIYVGGLRKEILVRKALRSKVFVNGGFLSERHDIDLKRGGILIKGESGCEIKVDKKSKIIYANKCRNDLGRYDYIKVNQKEGRNAFSKLVINHRKRHPAISERLVKYIKVGDKLAVIYVDE